MSLPKAFSLLVLGQGSTGLDVVSWACRHLGERVTDVTMYGGAKSKANDRTLELAQLGAHFEYGTEEVEGSYDICVASPGISEFSDFFSAGRAHAKQIMGEPEFSWRLSPDNWCAITGTNGKTTTTSLVCHLLRSAQMGCKAVGNIGDPSINELDGRPENEWFAAELSSYQIATTHELHPRVAVLLNITDDHLAWHRTHEAYAQAKLKLFENLTADDLAIVDVEDPGIMSHREQIFVEGRRVLSLGMQDPSSRDAAFVHDGMLALRIDGVKFDLVRVDELQIAGSHNVINALAAAAAAFACGAPCSAIRDGLRSFAPLEHRIEPVCTIDGVRYFNDSKATNTDAVEKALTAFDPSHLVLMLGGHDKGTPLEDFSRVVCAGTSRIVCFGEARERFAAALEAAGARDKIVFAEHLHDAVLAARDCARAGDTVLFSPACSSFDEFSGYEERGRVFKSYVEELRSQGDGDKEMGK